MITLNLVIYAIIVSLTCTIVATGFVIYGKIRNDLHMKRMDEATELVPHYDENGVHGLTNYQRRTLRSLYAQSAHPGLDPQSELLFIYRSWDRQGVFNSDAYGLDTLPIFAPKVTQNAILKQTRHRSSVKRGLAIALGGYPPLRLPTPVIASALHDSDGDVRMSAATSLELVATHEAAEYLIQGLRDKALPPQRITERLSHEWAVPACISAIDKYDGGLDIRNWLARALGLAGDPSAVPILAELCLDDSAENRINASRALGTCAHRGDREALHALRSLLNDEDEHVRGQTVTAIGFVGTGEDIPALVTALSDPGWSVRGNAASALLKLGPEGQEALAIATATAPDPYAMLRAAEVLSTRKVSREIPK